MFYYIVIHKTLIKYDHYEHSLNKYPGLNTQYYFQVFCQEQNILRQIHVEYFGVIRSYEQNKTQ